MIIIITIIKNAKFSMPWVSKNCKAYQQTKN